MTEIIRKRLFELQDLKYRDFQARLIPEVNKEQIIGVRTPELKKLAAELCKAADIDSFLENVPHKYFEENNLHGFIISECRDYHSAVTCVDAFLPFVDNWATCDQLKPKAFKKNKELLKNDIDRWISSERTYTIRFGIEMSMNFFLDEAFDPVFPEKIARLRSSEYYVNMMIAWYFATALSKKWDEIIPYIENRRLDSRTHNKTIQKAVESRRISDEQKAYLKSLKI